MADEGVMQNSASGDTQPQQNKKSTDSVVDEPATQGQSPTVAFTGSESERNLIRSVQHLLSL